MVAVVTGWPEVTKYNCPEATKYKGLALYKLVEKKLNDIFINWKRVKSKKPHRITFDRDGVGD